MYRTINMSIPAGQRQKRAISNRHVYVLQANYPEFLIGVNGEEVNYFMAGAVGFTAREGDSDIVEIEVYNPNASALDIVLGVSNMPITDNRVVFSGAIITKAATVTMKGAGQLSIDATGKSLVAENTSRAWVHIENESSTNEMLISSSLANLTADAGITIPPRGSAKIEAVNEIFAKGVGAAVSAKYQEFEQ